MQYIFDVEKQSFLIYNENGAELTNCQVLIDDEQHQALYAALAQGRYINKDLSFSEPRPTRYHVYKHGKWVDSRSLDEIKANKWLQIKADRNAFEFGTFEYDGSIFQCDQISAARILGATVAAIDQTWTLADNSTRFITGAEHQQLYAALSAHVMQAHARSRAAREAIDNANDADQVDTVVF